jgi:hypothetical protein
MSSSSGRLRGFTSPLSVKVSSRRSMVKSGALTPGISVSLTISFSFLALGFDPALKKDAPTVPYLPIIVMNDRFQIFGF